MITEITTALQSVKAAITIIKGISSLKSNIEVKEKSVELLDIIISIKSDMISLQSMYDELLQSKKDLEQKLLNINIWEETKVSYKLKKVADGVTVYVPKDLKENDDDFHWICANCFNEKKKSIIQLTNDDGYTKFYSCPKCGMHFNISYKRKGITIAAI